MGNELVRNTDWTPEELAEVARDLARERKQEMLEAADDEADEDDDFDFERDCGARP